ncbi:MAG TPA: TerB family tellurite resistance protein [Cyclobacteriaceae bacterium]
MGLFNKRPKNIPLVESHIKNLLEVALSDGHFDSEEYKLLVKIGKRHKAGKKMIEDIKKRMNNIDFVKPDTDSERFDQMFDLVTMMMADGEIDDKEIYVCNKYASRLGFDTRIVDELVRSISSNVELGHSLEETKFRIQYLLKN